MAGGLILIIGLILFFSALVDNNINLSLISLTSALILWVLYGLLEGNETLERFKRSNEGQKEGFAKVELVSVSEGKAGKADLVPPYDIHAEQGGNQRSVAMILRSRVLVGEVLQGRYDRNNGKYFEGPGPEQIPYQLSA